MGGRVLVEVGTTDSALTGAHALMMSASMRTEINLNLMGIGMALTAAQDPHPPDHVKTRPSRLYQLFAWHVTWLGLIGVLSLTVVFALNCLSG